MSLHCVSKNDTGVAHHNFNAKVKFAHTQFQFPSDGPRADPGVQAVSLQVTFKPSTQQ